MASSYVDRKVYVCYEDYTSKTCGICGEINDKLGGKEIFQCIKCGFKEDRDVNGARNIMLKRLSELASG